jgi:hypothetical protein
MFQKGGFFSAKIKLKIKESALDYQEKIKKEEIC